jgi:CysZ protein
MLNDFARAVGQLSDKRFMRVFLLSLVLTVSLLAALSYGWWWFTGGLAQIDLSLFGYSLGFLNTAVDWLARVGGILALGFLMMPVASLFIGLFLEEIADAVEAKHYPHARGSRKMGWGELLLDGVLFTMTLLAANLAALILYLIFLPIGPFIFIAVNGYFLGRQYFELVAARHVPFAEARRLRKSFGMRVWLAGALMAAPLSIPLLGLVIPVLGVATFTHIHHRLTRPA